MTRHPFPEAGRSALRAAVAFLFLSFSTFAQSPLPLESAEFRSAVGLYQRGLHWEAEKAFRAVTARFPRFGQGWFGLAMCHYETRRLEASLPYFEKAEACPEPEAQAFTNHAVALELMSRPEEAQRLLERAVEIDPAHANAWLNLGKLAARRGEGEVARRHLARCLALEPKNVEALIQRANLDLRERRLDDVRAALDALQRLSPENVAVAHVAARLARREGDREKARSLLMRWRWLHDEAEAAKRRAAKIASLHGLAFAALEASRVEEGVAYFAEILEVDPSDRQALSMLTAIGRKLAGSNRAEDRALVKRISGLLASSRRR